MEYSALIVAAGSGERLNLGYNKVLYQLTEDKTILDQVLAVFLADNNCQQIVLVMSKTDLYPHITQYTSGKVVLVLGGSNRAESVLNGLMAVTAEHVLIHDAARPYLTQALIDELLNELKTNLACIPVVPLKDTIKQIQAHKVIQTLNRTELFAAQTPQAFQTALIYESYLAWHQNPQPVTDDAQVLELYYPTPIKTILGDYQNIKITTSEDLN